MGSIPQDGQDSADGVAERYRRIAAGFTATVRAVPDDAWGRPAPCEGWVASDVVRHMVEWMPGFMEHAGLDIPQGPSVDDDPLGAWLTMSDAFQAALSDAAVATRPFDHPVVGRVTVAAALDQFMVGDILVHTWDLARATGLDETLDPDEVRRQLVAMEPYDEALRSSGHYGPKVEVAADADEQTRLIAFTGRQP
jgi:uncharacterized protein (TIGR03086 family)